MHYQKVNFEMMFDLLILYRLDTFRFSYCKKSKIKISLNMYHFIKILYMIYYLHTV